MMIASKNALLRYRIIDRCIRSSLNPFPSKTDFRDACEEEIFGSVDGSNICESTIEKDLFAMRNEHDAPIKFSRAEKGYYYSDTSYSLDEIPLNEKDVDAIKMAANILYQFKNSSLFDNFDFAISKILDRVNISRDVNDQDIENYVQFEKVFKAAGSEFLEKLLGAIKQKKKIQFMYQSFNATEAKLRRVHPYLLKEYRHRWYLIGKSELKNQIQTFGLDRLSDLIILDEHFTKEKEFNTDLFFKYSLGITANTGVPEEIIIATEDLLSKYLISQPLHFSQEYLGIDHNQKHRFSYFLLPTYELRTQLLGFGSEVTVIQPQTLIDFITETGMEIVSRYSK